MIFSALAQSSQTTLNNDIKLTYSFNSPTIETIDIAGTLYDRVTLLDCYPAGSAGEPKIPSKGAFLLLPPESKVSEIDIIPGEKIVLGSGLLVEPTSQAIPLSQTEDIPIPVPNEADLSILMQHILGSSSPKSVSIVFVDIKSLCSFYILSNITL